MSKLLYKGTQEIKGVVSYREVSPEILEIKLEAGHMMLSKADVVIVPDVLTKETKKRAKRAYKKATDTDVAGVVESEEQ